MNLDFLDKCGLWVLMRFFFLLQVFFNYLVIEHDEFYNDIVQTFDCEGTGHQCPRL